MDQDRRLIQTTNYEGYCWNRRTASAELLAPYYPRAESFERRYQEERDLGAADYAPEAA